MIRSDLIVDKAGKLYISGNFWQTKTRIDRLINTYITQEKLSDLLEELPKQFILPKPRPWAKIAWKNINAKEIVGIKQELFLNLIIGIVNTEAPIRGYTQTSRQYLAEIHPDMARFVGGVVGTDSKILELGLWEKEERQHSPALIKTYQQLTGNKCVINPYVPTKYQQKQDTYQDLYRHGLHRIITEYSAVCLYLWLMSQTSGTIQQVFSELLQDEINHMTKFLGFGVWLFPKFKFRNLSSSTAANKLSKKTQFQFLANLSSTFRRMMGVLHWHDWSIAHKLELIYTFIRVFSCLLSWHRTLTREYLEKILGKPELSA
ncbi:MAG: ferritin-like domain-containing protein [Prochloraceae cyanobacterium]|nr:ferritin-like domain-containing protein [Prochloraceae cyanobacterium]